MTSTILAKRAAGIAESRSRGDSLALIDGPGTHFTLGMDQQVTVFSVRAIKNYRHGRIGSRMFSHATRALCEEWLNRAGFRRVGYSKIFDAEIYARKP